MSTTTTPAKRNATVKFFATTADVTATSNGSKILSTTTKATIKPTTMPTAKPTENPSTCVWQCFTLGMMKINVLVDLLTFPIFKETPESLKKLCVASLEQTHCLAACKTGKLKLIAEQYISFTKFVCSSRFEDFIQHLPCVRQAFSENVKTSSCYKTCAPTLEMAKSYTVSFSVMVTAYIDNIPISATSWVLAGLKNTTLLAGTCQSIECFFDCMARTVQEDCKSEAAVKLVKETAKLQAIVFTEILSIEVVKKDSFPPACERFVSSASLTQKIQKMAPHHRALQ